jgi:hypothetical protein
MWLWLSVSAILVISSVLIMPASILVLATTIFVIATAVVVVATPVTPVLVVRFLLRWSFRFGVHLSSGACTHYCWILHFGGLLDNV